MNITIKSQTKNPLLNRTEVEAKIIFEGVTPKRKDIQQAIAKQLKVNERCTVVKKIDTQFGETNAKLSIYIYDDEQTLLRIERKNLVEKHVGHEPAVVEEED